MGGTERGTADGPFGATSASAEREGGMRINVVGRGLDVTDAIKKYAEDKAGKLTKHFGRIQQITATLIKKKVDHRETFEAELVLDVERHSDFVAHATSDDLYAAIDLVSEKAERQLRDWKERVKQKH
jgi:putative sigma-54 modulation protein